MDGKKGRQRVSLLLVFVLSFTMMLADTGVVSAAANRGTVKTIKSVSQSSVTTKENTIIEGTIADVVSYSYNGETKVLTVDGIPGASEPEDPWYMQKALKKGHPVFDVRFDVKKIILKEGYAAVKGAKQLISIMNRLEFIDVEEGNRYFASEDGVLLNQDKSVLIFYPSFRPGEVYEIPASVHKIGEPSIWSFSPFEFTRYVKTVKIHKGVTELTTYAFRCGDIGNSCSFEEFIVDENNSNYKSVDGVLFSKDGKRLITYPDCKADRVYTVPEGTEVIEWNAFQYTEHLETLTIAKSVSTVQDKAIDGYNNIKTLIFEHGSMLSDYPKNAIGCDEEGKPYRNSPELIYIPCNGGWNTEDVSYKEIIRLNHQGPWEKVTSPNCMNTGTENRVCIVCGAEETREIPVDSDAHSFTNYIYNNDAKVGVDGTETAVCDYGCGATDTRVKPGTALSGGSSGGGFIPPESSDNVTTDPEGNTNADLGAVQKPDGSTDATVDQETGDQIIDDAVNNGSSDITIDATTGKGDSDKTHVNIPAAVVKDIVDKTGAEIVIKTDSGDIRLDQDAAGAVTETGIIGTITFVVENTKESPKEMHFDFKVVTSKGEVKDFKGGKVSITVRLNKNLQTKDVACVYIDENGRYYKVNGVKNILDGSFTFITDHFSHYAILEKAEIEKVIKEQKLQRIKEGVQATIIKARSKAYKGKTKIYWTKSKGYKVDGYNVYKSTKKNGTYKFMGKTKKKYMYHTKNLKKGTRYYYYVQGYRTVDGEKIYTKKSLKAIRVAK